MYSVGLRIGEVVKPKVGDIDVKKRFNQNKRWKEKGKSLHNSF